MSLMWGGMFPYSLFQLNCNELEVQQRQQNKWFHKQKDSDVIKMVSIEIRPIREAKIKMANVLISDVN